MTTKCGAKAIIWLRGARAFWDEVFLAALSPKKFDAQRSDRALGKDVERRWKDHTLSVWCLVYERDDKKRYEADLKAGKASNTTPAPTKPDFVVFLDPSLSVDWIMDGTPGNQAMAIISEAEAVAAVDCGFLRRSQLQEFRSQVAHAMVCALQDETDKARYLLEQAKHYLSKRTVEQSRVWTLGSLLAIAALALAGVSIWKDSCFFRGIDAKIWASIFGGLCGGFASMAAATAKGTWDAAAGPFLHFLEVLMRACLGAIFGVIATMLALSSFGPKPFQELASDWRGCVVIAFAAGLFEKTVPRILSQYSKPEPTPAARKKK